jgi:hypothetical protein
LAGCSTHSRGFSIRDDRAGHDHCGRAIAVLLAGIQGASAAEGALLEEKGGRGLVGRFRTSR